MNTGNYSLTKVFFMLLSALVFLLFLFSRSIHPKGQMEMSSRSTVQQHSMKPALSLANLGVRRTSVPTWDGNVTGSDPEERFFGALLGQSHPFLDPPTKRALCQAFLFLNHVTRFVNTIGANYSPTDSVIAGFRSYGQTLFRSDYGYACRLCPELDPDAADVVYTNAMAALRVGEFVQTASNVVDQTYHSGGLKRPPAPLADHYAVPFRPTAEQEETRAYKSLLAALQEMAGYDPLSTDLFNDAVVYVMSIDFERKSAEETARMQARIARWERLGLPPSLDDDGNYPEHADILASLLDEGTDNSYTLSIQGYREIFGYRFSEYHGLPKDETLKQLEKFSVPPATWVHIRARRD